jgi:hypothetical protein
MTRGVLILVLICLLCAVKPAHAGGMGKFLGSLLARGLVREAIIAFKFTAAVLAKVLYPGRADSRATCELH